ncbi:hypothetical protein L596_009695 [Steinernema carpocapsae]|uniref:Uncharacterized protein n=1 Tax=Steinernema carpocapsae TaxID=34508 RepID=A0A4U5PGX1_STECR|nr:hypothetical protein L596_009695 [Steinernema carpocapsae]
MRIKQGQKDGVWRRVTDCLPTKEPTDNGEMMASGDASAVGNPAATYFRSLSIDQLKTAPRNWLVARQDKTLGRLSNWKKRKIRPIR